MNNILQSLIRVKQSFLDSANRQADVIASITQPELNLSKSTIVTGDGNAINMWTSTVGKLKQLNIAKVGKDGEEQAASIIAGDDGEFDLETEITGLGNSLGDVLLDIKETMDVNSAITGVASMFQTHTTVDVNTLCNYLDVNTDKTSQGVNQFKAVITANCLDGKITQRKFLQILDCIMHAGKDANQQGSLVMDKGSAYYIKNAIATVLSTMAQVLATVLAAVLTAISRVIGAIFYALYSLVNVAWSKLSQSVNTSIAVIDAESNTNFFEGAAIAISKTFKYDAGNLHNYLGLDTSVSDKAYVFDLGPIVSYVWPGQHDIDKIADRSATININSFFAMNLHPTRTIKYLIDKGYLKAQLTGTSVSGGLKWRWIGSGEHDFRFGPECFLTLEELITLPYQSGDVLCEYAGFIFAALGLLHLVPFNFELTSGVWAGAQQVPSSLFYNGTNAMWNLTGMFLNYVAHYLVDGDTHNVGHLYKDTQSNYTQLAMDYLTWNGQTWDSYVMQDFEQNSPIDGAMLLGDFAGYGKVYYFTNVSRHFIYSNGFTPSTGYNFSKFILANDAELVDAIPTQRMFAFPRTNWTEVILAIGAAVAISGAAVATFAIGKALIKRNSLTVQTKQWDKLQKARKQYEKDPDNKANLKDYRKQIKRYNKWGKIFGYGTYDASNNWNNELDTSINPDFSGDGAELSSGIQGMMNTLTGNGTITLDTLQGEKEVTLSDIKLLIAGC